MTAYSTSGGMSKGAPAMSSNDPYYKEKRPHGMQPYSYQKFTPEQQQLFQSLFSHLSPDSDLSKLAAGDEEAYAEMEAPALRQFSGVMGNLASKFSGMGMGGRKSSGFNLAGTAAASDFAQDLASKRQETKRNALNDLMSMSNMLMGQQPMDKGFISKQEKKPGFFESIGQGFSSAFGGAAGKAAGKATGNFF